MSLREQINLDELVEMYEAGLSIRDIAEMEGCSFGVIRNLLLEQGVEFRKNARAKIGILPEQLTKWVYLLGRGFDNLVIEQMGQTVDLWRKRKEDREKDDVQEDSR